MNAKDDLAVAIEARQRANGCNQDNDPDEWGVPCCDRCFCAYEAVAFCVKEEGHA